MSWRYNPNPNAKLAFGLYMDVLQLLGVSYVVARVIYCLPVGPRLAVAGLLYVWHWGLLRFYPQGSIPAGTFTEEHNAVGYIYSHPTGFWWFFRTVHLAPWLAFNICGMLSVPTAAATMTIGTWAGELLRKKEAAMGVKVRRLMGVGAVLAVLGFVWAFDLPMNKPRWTPCYLLWCSGMGLMLLGLVYWVVDVRGQRWWTWPFVVLGVNAIGIYFLSVFGKVWALNMPRVRGDMLKEYLISSLQEMTNREVGSWLFTGGFVLVLWGIAAVAYRFKVVWKV
jgi:predicted acyltransferase